MPSVRLSPDVYKRLQGYADGRPLGKAIERLLDGFLLVGGVHVEEYTGKDGQPRTRGTAVAPLDTLQLTNLARGTQEPAEAIRAAEALKEHLSMQERMSEGWQKIPEHEHPQLTSEPDDPPAIPPGFEYAGHIGDPTPEVLEATTETSLPLDAEGIPPDSAKGKTTAAPSRPKPDEDRRRAFQEKHGK